VIEAVVYSGDGVEPYDDLAAAKAAQGTTWVRGVDADRATLQSVADAFDVHPLVVEDVVTNVRPKSEEFRTYTFCLVKDAELTRGETVFDEEVSETAVGIVLGDDWVLTLSTEPVPAVERVWDAVERGDERLLERGPDFTAYRVMDVVIDDYFRLLDRIESAIEEIEEEVLVSTDIGTLEAINNVRRDLLSFRKVAWPMREAVGLFARGDPDQVQQSTEKYFRDVYDHLVQVVDLIETYRDLTASARDIYLNTLSQSTNEVMKRLTVVAVVFLPLSFVAGLFGMNFGTMPELGWPLGYYAVLLGMGLVAAVLLAHFRSVGYL
jgi:magnesium transporter